MKKLYLFILFVMALLSAGASVPLGSIPFIYYGHLYIQATLQDTVPVSVIYDTGASHICLDKTFMQLSHFLENRDNNCVAEMVGGGNNDFISVPVIAEPLKITMGRIGYTEECNPILNFREVIGRHIDGLIGIESFANKIILINYADEYILPLAELNDSILDGFTKLPAQFKDNRIYVEAELKVDSIQSVKGPFILDLGAGTTLVLTSSVRESLDLTNKATSQFYSSNYGIGGDGTIGLFRSDAFNMLDDLDDVVVYVSFSTNGMLSKSEKYLGILGNGILSNYDLIIDDLNKSVYARPNQNQAETYQSSSRYHMKFIDRTDICDGWVVTALYDQGIAQQAGIEIGDIILSINDRPTKEITWEEQRRGLDLNGNTQFKVLKKDGTTAVYTLHIHHQII